MDSAPVGHNPNSSVFQGGDSVQITPMAGGALPGTQPVGDANVLNTIAPSSRQSVMSAALQAGLLAAVTPGPLTPQAAALSAGIRQAFTEKTRDDLKGVPLSDADNKLLVTVRDGQERQGAENAARVSYDAAISKRKSEAEARVDSLNASIDFIKNYRKTNPFDDSTVSLKYTQRQVDEILATKDPKEQEVGKIAYDAAFNAAKSRGKSNEDATKIAILDSVSAIDDYRKNVSTSNINRQTTIKVDKAVKLLNTDDPDEKELGEFATMKAIKKAKESGVSDDKELAEIGTIAAAERIETFRGDKKVGNIPRREGIKTSMLSAINEVKDIPLYIEYSEADKSLRSPYIEILEKKTADAMVGKSFQAYMREQIAAYQTSQMKSWTSASTKTSPSFPQTKNKTNFARQQEITSFSRLIHILPVTTVDIVVLPPMNGSLSKFMETIQSLDQMGVINSDYNIKENTVLVWTVPFYSAIIDATGIANNSILLSFFLEIKMKNEKQWFVLADNTSDGYLVGSTLIGRAPNDILINMLEPSYVVYPYKRKNLEGIIISNSKGNINLPGDASTNPDTRVTMQSIYKDTNYGKTIMKTFKPSFKSDLSVGHFTVVGAIEPMKIPSERIGSCGLANYSLPELIPTLHPSNKIKVSSTKGGSNVIIAFRLQSNDIYEPLCVRGATIQKETQNKFIGSPEAEVDPLKVSTASFEVAGKIFEIRKTNKQDIVYNNWKKALYSNSEADLLNTLNLKPSIMEEIFPLQFNEQGIPITNRWNEWVAAFLSTITIKDNNLTTHREMMVVRNFLERVNNYFLSRRLIKDLDEDSDSDDDKPSNKQHSLSEPSDIGLSDIPAETFQDIKRSYGNNIDVYENTETNQWICSLILVNKHTYKQLYRSIGVPTSQYTNDRAVSALKEKINNLKKKYSDWIFIY